MTDLIKIERKRTILISISILLVSVYTIYSYSAVRSEVETGKLIQQLIRFLLTVVLLFFVYQGKNWARVLSIVLFSIAILGALFALLMVQAPTLYAKLPLLVMLVVYSVAVFHFGLSKSFKAFLDYQNDVTRGFDSGD